MTCNNILQYSEGGSRVQGIRGPSIFGFRCCLHYLVNGFFSLRAPDGLYQIDLVLVSSPLDCNKLLENNSGMLCPWWIPGLGLSILTRIITISGRLRAPGSLEWPGGGNSECKACLSQTWTAHVSSPPPQKGLQVSVASRTLILRAWLHLPSAVCPASSSNLGAGPASDGAGKV